MTTIQDIRNELSTFAPEGYEGYGELPSNAQIPSIVADLPDSIELGASMTYTKLNMKLVVVVGSAFGVETESRLLSDVVALAKTLNGISGSSFRSCHVLNIDEFYTIKIGGKEALSAAINLEIHAEL